MKTVATYEEEYEKKQFVMLIILTILNQIVSYTYVLKKYLI